MKRDRYIRCAMAAGALLSLIALLLGAHAQRWQLMITDLAVIELAVLLP